MNNSNNSMLVALTSFVIICLSAKQFVPVVQADLIIETCSKSYLHSMCVSVLRSDPRSSNAKDVKALARLLLEICIENATDTLKVIRKLQASDSKLEKLLSRCTDDYKVAIEDDFGGAMKKIQQHAYEEAAKLAYLGGARGPVDCEGTYAEKKKGSPIRKRNSDVAYLALLAQSIVLLIHDS